MTTKLCDIVPKEVTHSQAERAGLQCFMGKPDKKITPRDSERRGDGYGPALWLALKVAAPRDVSHH